MIMAVANHGFSGRGDVGAGAHRGSRPSNDDPCVKVFDLEANVTIKECNGDVENSDDDEIDVSPRFGPNGKFMHYEERSANQHEVQDLSPSASIPLEDNHTNRSQKRDRKWVLMFALVLVVCIVFAVYLAGGNHKQNLADNTLTVSQESITADDVIASPASNDPLQNANIDSEAGPINKKHTHVKKEHPNNESKKPHKQHTHEKKDHPNRPGQSTSTHVEIAPETLLDQSEIKYEDPLEEQSLFIEEEDVLQENPNDDSSQSIAHEQSVHNIFASDSD